LKDTKPKLTDPLAYELNALSKYKYLGGVSASGLGLSYSEAHTELAKFREWLLEAKGEFFEDKLLELLKLRAGQVKMEKVLKAFTPVMNRLAYTRPEITETMQRGRRRLLRTVPMVTVILLYGFLKATGRLVNQDAPSHRTAKSSLFFYKLCKEMEDDFEGILTLFQGFVDADLPKLMLLSANTSPVRGQKKITKRGFPPALLWLLKKYMEIMEYEREYNS